MKRDSHHNLMSAKQRLIIVSNKNIEGGFKMNKQQTKTYNNVAKAIEGKGVVLSPYYIKDTIEVKCNCGWISNLAPARITKAETMGKKGNIESTSLAHIWCEGCRLAKARELCAKDGYELLSTEFKGANSRLRVRCPGKVVNGKFVKHETEKEWSALKMGRHCSECNLTSIETVMERLDQDKFILDTKTIASSLDKIVVICKKCNRPSEKFFSSLHFPCKYCSHDETTEKQKLPIEEVRRRFMEKNFKVLSDRYENSFGKLLVEHSCGYRFLKTLNCLRNIIDTTGCPQCEGNRKYEIKEVIQICAARGYTILNPKIYECARTIMKMECPEGCITSKTFNSVLNDEMCLLCFYKSRQLPLSVISERCAKAELKFIGPYEGTNVPCLVQCGEGHRTYKVIREDMTKCIECTGNRGTLPYTQEMADVIYEDLGLTLLDVYKGTKHRHWVKCIAKDHIGRKSIDRAREGHICNTCSRLRMESLGASICREIIHELMGMNYEDEKVLPNLPRKRYDFALIYKGRRYIIEYDGPQHFKYVPLYHTDENNFLAKQEIDRLKTYMAWFNGYNVIRVSGTDKNHIRDFIMKCLNKVEDTPWILCDGPQYQYLNNPRADTFAKHGVKIEALQPIPSNKA